MNDFKYNKIMFKAVPKIGYTCIGCAFKDKGCAGLRTSKQIPECWERGSEIHKFFIFKPKKG